MMRKMPNRNHGFSVTEVFAPTSVDNNASQTPLRDSRGAGRPGSFLEAVRPEAPPRTPKSNGSPQPPQHNSTARVEDTAAGSSSPVRPSTHKNKKKMNNKNSSSASHGEKQQQEQSQNPSPASLPSSPSFNAGYSTDDSSCRGDVKSLGKLNSLRRKRNGDDASCPPSPTPTLTPAATTPNPYSVPAALNDSMLSAVSDASSVCRCVHEFRYRRDSCEVSRPSSCVSTPVPFGLTPVPSEYTLSPPPSPVPLFQPQLQFQSLPPSPAPLSRLRQHTVSSPPMMDPPLYPSFCNSTQVPVGEDMWRHEPYSAYVVCDLMNDHRYVEGPQNDELFMSDMPTTFSSSAATPSADWDMPLGNDVFGLPAPHSAVVAAQQLPPGGAARRLPKVPYEFLCRCWGPGQESPVSNHSVDYVPTQPSSSERPPAVDERMSFFRDVRWVPFPRSEFPNDPTTTSTTPWNKPPPRGATTAAAAPVAEIPAPRSFLRHTPTCGDTGAEDDTRPLLVYLAHVNPGTVRCTSREVFKEGDIVVIDGDRGEDIVCIASDGIVFGEKEPAHWRQQSVRPYFSSVRRLATDKDICQMRIARAKSIEILSHLANLKDDECGTQVSQMLFHEARFQLDQKVVWIYYSAKPPRADVPFQPLCQLINYVYGCRVWFLHVNRLKAKRRQPADEVGLEEVKCWGAGDCIFGKN